MKDLKNLSIDQYLNILWRRRWYAIITAILIASGASVYIWRMPNIYKSEARLLVEAPFVSEDYVRPIVRSSPGDRIIAIREQIASRTFLERIVEQFQYGGFGAQPDFVMEDAVRYIRKQIGIDITSENTFLISFTSSDPQIARDVTKRLAEELIRSNTASRMDKALATDQFLDEQLRQASQNLSAQEDKIKQFKTAHLGELPEQADSNVNVLSGLYGQLNSAENALQQILQQQKILEFKVQTQKNITLLQNASKSDAQVKPHKGDDPNAAVKAELAAKKALRSELLQKYTLIHPDVDTVTAQIQQLEQKLKESGPADATEQTASQSSTKIDNEKNFASDQALEAYKFESDGIKSQIDKREKEKNEIQRQIKLYQARLNQAPALEQQLAALVREEEALKQQYTNLVNKKFGSGMAATMETDKKNETYKIIDQPSLPTKPESPNRAQYLLMALGASLVLGICAAFGRELLDSTIGSEEEAAAVLNLPVLVSVFEIPHVERKSVKKLLKQKEQIA
jgi:polysaccharide biosynthesis transport protein